MTEMLSASALAQAIRAGRLTPTDVATLCADAIRAKEDEIRAFAAVDLEALVANAAAPGLKDTPLAGLPVGSSLTTRPPFEAPHHTATAAALVGGGSGQIRPGAAARASHGVLFLDEAKCLNIDHLCREWFTIFTTALTGEVPRSC